MNIVNNSVNKYSLSYLLSLRKVKGCQIIYNKLEMTDYLRGNGNNLTTLEKQQMFSYRIDMNDIPANFSSRNEINKCISCESIENNQHIYECKKLSLSDSCDEQNIEYEQIYNGPVDGKISVSRILKKKLEQRKKMSNIIPSDSFFNVIH